MLKLKLTTYTLCLLTVLMIATTSSAQASDTIATDFSDLEAIYDWPKFDDEQIKLAEAIHNRTYHLYPASFYQKEFDDEDYYSDVLQEENLDYTERKTYQCLLEINQPSRYEQFLRYTAYDYVRHTQIEEVKDNVKMLNYFFIDELAAAIKTGDIDNLHTNLKSKLKRENLESEYKAFLTTQNTI